MNSTNKKIDHDLIISSYNHYLRNSLFKMLSGIDILEQKLENDSTRKDEFAPAIKYLKKGCSDITQLTEVLQSVQDLDKLPFQVGRSQINVIDLTAFLKNS